MTPTSPWARRTQVLVRPTVRPPVLRLADRTRAAVRPYSRGRTESVRSAAPGGAEAALGALGASFGRLLSVALSSSCNSFASTYNILSVRGAPVKQKIDCPRSVAPLRQLRTR